MADDDQQNGHPLGAGQDTSPVTARDTVNAMVEAGLLNQVMTRADAGELALTGDGGFLPEMIKAVLERGLAAEQTAHLGYGKGDPGGRGTANSRNGSTPKTLHTEAGEVGLDVPRDRNGSFEPRLVPKGSWRTGGLDEMIISLYAGGMTVRDIGHRAGGTFEPGRDAVRVLRPPQEKWPRRCGRSTPPPPARPPGSSWRRSPSPTSASGIRRR